LQEELVVGRGEILSSKEPIGSAVVVKTVVLGPIELPDDLAESIKLRI